jgi:hypothetical protein
MSRLYPRLLAKKRLHRLVHKISETAINPGGEARETKQPVVAPPGAPGDFAATEKDNVGTSEGHTPIEITAFGDPSGSIGDADAHRAEPTGTGLSESTDAMDSRHNVVVDKMNGIEKDSFIIKMSDDCLDEGFASKEEHVDDKYRDSVVKGANLDPYVVGRKYSYSELLPDHKHEVDINKRLGSNRSEFYWLRTSMSTDDLIEESRQWYDKNVNVKWSHKDTDKVYKLADRFINAATCRPLLVSPPGEENGGLWEGYHRLHASALMAIDKVPVLMAINLRDDDWYTKVAQFDNEPWICVDFDGTIARTNEDDSDGEITGEIIPGVQDVLQKLIDKGYRVSIYSARASSDDSNWESKLEDFLDANDIPYTDIHRGPKPPADAFVDNKALHFDGDWSGNIIHEIDEMVHEAKIDRIINAKGIGSDDMEANDSTGRISESDGSDSKSPVGGMGITASEDEGICVDCGIGNHQFCHDKNCECTNRDQHRHVTRKDISKLKGRLNIEEVWLAIGGRPKEDE